jgi:hypothetical protein
LYTYERELHRCKKILIKTINERKAYLFDKLTYKLIKAFDYEMVTGIDFSPSGKYLVLIQKPDKDIENNFKVIATSDFSEVIIKLILGYYI